MQFFFCRLRATIHHCIFQFLANNTAAILYLTDNENYGRDSVASQYFMQLAQYVKLPMISWNADNSAFEMGSLQLQLAPTLKQQASAMLTVLERYSWNTFSIITGTIAGHHNFEIVSQISKILFRSADTFHQSLVATLGFDLKWPFLLSNVN